MRDPKIDTVLGCLLQDFFRQHCFSPLITLREDYGDSIIGFAFGPGYEGNGTFCRILTWSNSSPPKRALRDLERLQNPMQKLLLDVWNHFGQRFYVEEVHVLRVHPESHATEDNISLHLRRVSDNVGFFLYLSISKGS